MTRITLLLALAAILASCSDDTGARPGDHNRAMDAGDTGDDSGSDLADTDDRGDAGDVAPGDAADDASLDGTSLDDATTDATADDGGDADAEMLEVEFQTGTEVTTSTGDVAGEDDDDLRVFKGIPYAEAPTGENRFRAPTPVGPWDGTLDASDYGDSCIQAPFSFNQTSEDCLSLNVWAHNDDTERPVMVWIYGGGFILGESATPFYDGADLARDADVVVISINYRLGVLANLALPELAEEDPMGSVGNMGLLDQIEALRWIKHNAPAFGGDPDNITVFGESAGAISTCALLGTPMADELFDKAILQSGNCALLSSTEPAPFRPNTVYDVGEIVVEELGCAEADDRLACLRELPADDFAEAIDFTVLFGDLLTAEISLGPTVDGVVIPKQPYQRIADGEAPDRPMIAGSNGNEGALFTQTAIVITRSDLEDQIEQVVGDEALAEMVADLYSPLTYPLPRDAWSAFVGELLFNCNAYHTVELLGDRGYYYHLLIAPPILTTPYGPYHAADIFYVFGNFATAAIIPTLLDLDLSARVQTAWGSFARTGQPSWEGGWPSIDSGEHLQIDLVPGPEDTFRNGRCDDLRELGILP